MDIDHYKAKPEQTIGEHKQELLKVLALLKEYGYISQGKIYDLVEFACIHHDDGKANREFQTRVTSKKWIRFNPEKEVPHNVLSGYFLDKSKFEEEVDYYRVLFAVMFHHDYGKPQKIIYNQKDLIKELLKDFSTFTIKKSSVNHMLDMIEDPEAMRIKGFLHKCDYSASGGYTAEYPNDFLEKSMENIRIKWRRNNPESDWNELQKFCMEKRNDNIIVVAQTGMGKTEAGLQWIGNWKGYFVLPLRTAINAIYDRVRYDILQNEKIDTRLSVLHSESLEYYFKQDKEDGMNLMEYEKRGKRFSLPLNISTMDQLFDFVFRYQGYEMKLVTFSYSKIVVDEIQMYDPKLLAYLIQGLKMITQMGGKVAVMTATLAPFVKELLREAIEFKAENIRTFTNDMVRHHVKVMDSMINSDDILKLYDWNRMQGNSNKILVVCNTVKKAQSLFTELEEQMDIPKELHILHSRFIRNDRTKKEQEIIDFGVTYDESGDIDQKSGIWISTSLVEASLDIDFDYLFTELQDLNSLFQRFGRCNRKGKKSTLVPNCYVYLNIEDNYLSGSKSGFIDRTIFEISKQAIQSVSGPISEAEKIGLIDQYLTIENVGKSSYYREYVQTIEWIKNIVPYEFNKEENHLRNILSQDIIPSGIYEEHLEEIQKNEKILLDRAVLVKDKITARESIMKYAVSISQWDVLKISKDNRAQKYPSVHLGEYEKIPVLECIYDRLGYRKIDYDHKVREANIL